MVAVCAYGVHRENRVVQRAHHSRRPQTAPMITWPRSRRVGVECCGLLIIRSFYRRANRSTLADPLEVGHRQAWVEPAE